MPHKKKPLPRFRVRGGADLAYMWVVILEDARALPVAKLMEHRQSTASFKGFGKKGRGVEWKA